MTQLSHVDILALTRALNVVRPIHEQAAEDACAGLSSILVTRGPMVKSKDLSDKDRTLLADVIDRLVCLMMCEGKGSDATSDAEATVEALRELLKQPDED